MPEIPPGAAVTNLPNPLQAMHLAIRGASMDNWFSPGQPVPAQAPPGITPREQDYPVGYNIQIPPRSEEATSFQTLRALATGWPLLSSIIDARKKQVLSIGWTIRPKRLPGEGNREYRERTREDTTAAEAAERWVMPDGNLLFEAWMRKLLDDQLILDGLAMWPHDGQVDILDAATITRKLNLRGRIPSAPDVAYQQSIKGMPSVDFYNPPRGLKIAAPAIPSPDKNGRARYPLLYYIQNPRTWKIYGFSPVEQIILIVNLAIRREMFRLAYYTEGNIPEAIIQMPANWTHKQLRIFEDEWNDLLAGNNTRRRARFIPSIGGNGQITWTKEVALKDDMDEWLARVACFCMDMSPQPFIKENNRATAETAMEAQKASGLRPLLNYNARVFTDVLQRGQGYHGLEWAWEADVETDPLQRAQVQKLQAETGTKTIDQLREDNGDEPLGLPPGVLTAQGYMPFDMTAALDVLGHEDDTGDYDVEQVPMNLVTKRAGGGAAWSTRGGRVRARRAQALVRRFLQEEAKAVQAGLAVWYKPRSKNGNGKGHS